MTRLNKALTSVVYVCLAVMWVFSGWIWGKGITALFFSSFVLQSALLGLYAQKLHKRLAINWALLSLVMNVGIFVLFEIHMPGKLGSDNVAELGISVIITTATLIITLLLLQHDSNQQLPDLLVARPLYKGFSDCG
jgi:hypothetical protein